MKKTLIALTIATALSTADEFTPPGSIPTARPRFTVEEEKTSRWLVSGDLLYWAPEMDGLHFANRRIPHYVLQQKTKGAAPQVTKTTRDKPRELKGDWEPGVRVSMGYLFDEKGWDVLTSWSYYRTEPTAHLIKKENEREVVPTNLSQNGFFATTVNSAKAKWTLAQNSADIEVGRNFPVGDVFLARPFCGIKGVTIKSKTMFEYNLESSLMSATSTLHTKSNFTGAGPRLGGNLAYEFGKGIGIFFLGSGSLLYGQFTASFDGIPKELSNLKTMTAMQIQMGAQWRKTFANKYHLGILASWEQNFYSKVNQAVKYLNNNRFIEEGDVALKGLTASCHLDF